MLQEDRYVDGFYERYKGRVAIGVGYARDMMEIYPFVLEDDRGNLLGIVAMATLSDENMTSVHIFHLSVFNQRCGNGSKMLKNLCQKADQLNIILSLSPIPSPNGNDNQISDKQLARWYRTFGFSGDSVLCRLPQTTKVIDDT